MFKNVIVRKPAKSMIDGITSAPELGKPDYELAVKQHDSYIAALKQCGVEVTELEALEEYPELEEVIGLLDGVITEEKMRKMNYEVDENKRNPKEVAVDFLKSEGIIE